MKWNFSENMLSNEEKYINYRKYHCKYVKNKFFCMKVNIRYILTAMVNAKT